MSTIPKEVQLKTSDQFQKLCNIQWNGPLETAWIMWAGEVVLGQVSPKGSLGAWASDLFQSVPLREQLLGNLSMNKFSFLYNLNPSWYNMHKEKWQEYNLEVLTLVCYKAGFSLKKNAYIPVSETILPTAPSNSIILRQWQSRMLSKTALRFKE